MEQEALNQLRTDAKKFRKIKVIEVFRKGHPTELELWILSKWSEHYQEDIYDRD